MSSVAPDLLKAPAILFDKSTRKSAVDQEDEKPCWKSEKKNPIFLEVIKKPISYKCFKKLTNHRKKNNRMVLFSCTPLPNILK